jgi:hypothetical protein
MNRHLYLKAGTFKHHADCPANKSSIGAPEYNSFKNPQQ